MSKRVIVGLQPDIDWAELKRALSEVGAQAIGDPTLRAPASVVVTLDDATDAAAFIERVQRCPEVRYAEMDSWASTGPIRKP
jgi:cell division protein FtsX